MRSASPQATRLGPAFSASGGALGQNYVGYSYEAGYFAGPAGVWTELGMALGFTLSGGGDLASINVFTEIAAVPLPGA